MVFFLTVIFPVLLLTESLEEPLSFLYFTAPPCFLTVMAKMDRAFFFSFDAFSVFFVAFSG